MWQQITLFTMCYTISIQRIHYGPHCSPLWLILKIISLLLLLGLTQPPNAEVSSSGVVDWAPSTARVRTVQKAKIKICQKVSIFFWEEKKNINMFFHDPSQ